jgi:predicted transcriptional regulator
MTSLAVRVEYPAAMITPAQIRAARALLGWKQTDLSAAAGVSEISVKNIERGATDARGSTLGKLQTALEGAGIEIIPSSGASISGGPGVRLRS